MVSVGSEGLVVGEVVFPFLLRTMGEWEVTDCQEQSWIFPAGVGRVPCLA